MDDGAKSDARLLATGRVISSYLRKRRVALSDLPARMRSVHESFGNPVPAPTPNLLFPSTIPSRMTSSSVLRMGRP